MIKFIALLGAIGMAFVAVIPSKEIQKDSEVTFEVSNMKARTVKGSFGGMTGTIKFNPDQLDSSVFDVCIDAATVNTDNPKRDAHLKNKDFFYVEKFPTICIKSSTVEKVPSGYLLKGTMTMHGRTKPIDAVFSFKENVFFGVIMVNRLDYGVGKGTSKFTVGNEVKVTIKCKVQ